MKFNKLFATGLVAVSALTLAACSSSNENAVDKIKEKGTLVVAMSPDYAPFEFKTLVDGKDTIVGADVELANAIGEKLGVKVEFSAMSFNNVLSSLNAGKADIAISGISATPERAEAYDFSDVYYESSNVVVVKKADLESYKTVADLKGKGVGAQKGSIQEGIANDQLSESKVTPLVQMNEIINELKSGKLDGAVIEKAIADGYVAKNSDLAISEIAVKDEDSLGNAVAMPKGSTELKEEINQVIKALKAEGKIDQFVQEAFELSEK